MSNRTRPRTRLLTGLIAGPLALTLVACGGSDDNSDTTDNGATGNNSATGAPTTPDSSSSAPSASSVPSTDALLDAAQTALTEVPDSTVFSIDTNNRGWEVSLVAADGTESEVGVSADGATVTRGPVTDDDGENDDRNDQAERQRLLQDARVDYAAAIEAARADVPEGTVTGVELDDDNGTATWDVQLDEDTATEQTVTVDAASGEVLRTERDD